MILFSAVHGTYVHMSLSKSIATLSNVPSHLAVNDNAPKETRNEGFLSILGSLFEKHIQKDHIQDNK